MVIHRNSLLFLSTIAILFHISVMMLRIPRATGFLTTGTSFMRRFRSRMTIKFYDPTAEVDESVPKKPVVGNVMLYCHQNRKK
jgi:hypothetical protein